MTCCGSSTVTLFTDSLVYRPPNQTKDEGNDDQSTWALAAMTAAERGFPSRDGAPSWLALAQNVFDDQAARWDNATCGGGLRWQIFSFNDGYNYKNSMSNGFFMQLAARLARFTGNSTYPSWAQQTYEWSLDAGLVQNGSATLVYDGLFVDSNCAIDNDQWTANLGTYLAAASFLQSSNSSDAAYWSNATESLLVDGCPVFLVNDSQILTEGICMPNPCNWTDELAFKAILARAWANLKNLNSSVPQDDVRNWTSASAVGAAAQCSGGENKTTCGSDWTSSVWDGSQGLGQDLSALEIFLANLPAKQLFNASTATTLSGNATDGGNGATATSSGPSGTQSSGAASASPTSTGGAVGCGLPPWWLDVLLLGCVALLLW